MNIVTHVGAVKTVQWAGQWPGAVSSSHNNYIIKYPKRSNIMDKGFSGSDLFLVIREAGHGNEVAEAFTEFLDLLIADVEAGVAGQHDPALAKAEGELARELSHAAFSAHIDVEAWLGRWHQAVCRDALVAGVRYALTHPHMDVDGSAALYVRDRRVALFDGVAFNQLENQFKVQASAKGAELASNYQFALGVFFEAVELACFVHGVQLGRALGVSDGNV